VRSGSQGLKTFALNRTAFAIHAQSFSLMMIAERLLHLKQIE
jgi:hypothetical protein